MLKDKMVKVFDKEAIRQGDIVTLGRYISGDDGSPELHSKANAIVKKVTEDSITLFVNSYDQEMDEIKYHIDQLQEDKGVKIIGHDVYLDNFIEGDE